MNTFEEELVSGVDLRLEPREQGLHVSVAETFDDSPRPVYSASHKRDFYTSQQKRREIANEINDQVSDHIDGDAVAERFRAVCTQLDSKHDEIKQRLRPPAVQQILDETQSVEVFGGEPTTVRVTLEHGGKEAPIEFTSGEWVAGDAGKLNARYHQRFFERLDMESEDWDELVEAWEEMQEIVHDERQTELDSVVEEVIDGLARRVKAHDTRDAIENDTYSAWMQTDYDGMDNEIPQGEDVLWVRSTAVSEQLEEAGKSKAYISELSKGLKAESHTHRATKRKRDKRVYPFDPDSLGIDPEWDVHSDDDGPEVQP